MKSKGFTLIEIIISLVLIVSICLITIISLNNNKNEKNVEKHKKELETAVDVVSEKLKSYNELKQFTETEIKDETTNIIAYFCLSKETLISEGIVSEDNELVKGITDNEYFKVSQDNMGTYIFDHPVSIDECKYIKSKINNTNVENTEEKKINKLNLEKNGYYLSQHLLPKEEGDNKYSLKMNFSFNTGKLNETSYKPKVYTIFVLDG